MEQVKGKRELIIQAAMKIFARDGFHKAKVGDIAEEAGIGKGTIYEYFKSKKNVFEEMIKYSLSVYLENIQEIFHKENSTEQKLKAFIIQAQALAQNHIDILKISSQENGVAGENIMKIIISTQSYILKEIENIFQQGIEKNELRKLDIETAAISFIGAVKSFMIFHHFSHQRMMKEDEIDRFLDIYMNGLKR